METTESANRPWGSYAVIDEGEGFKVKRITVIPGKRLSLQQHAQRAEHWFVVEGAGVVTVDDRRIDVTPGDAIDIPVGAVHRVEAAEGTSPLVFVEVQRGGYLGEDDIVRFEDDYGRVATS